MDVPVPVGHQLGAVTTDLTQSVMPTGNLQITPELLTLILQMQASAAMPPTPFESTNRGSWNQAEDELLVTAVAQLGARKWTDVAKCVPTRTSKQCRERWFNRLCPDVKHEPFESWEDDIIIGKQKEFGNRWSVIARYLPGRSANSIKNRWYSGLKTQHDHVAHLRMGLGFEQSNVADLIQPTRDIGMHNDYPGPNPSASDL
jgi:hypothetical protein